MGKFVRNWKVDGGAILGKTNYTAEKYANHGKKRKTREGEDV